METMSIEIARNITTAGDRAEILGRQDGKRVRFQFADHAAALKALRKMLKNGASYLDTSEDGMAYRWISAPVIR